MQEYDATCLVTKFPNVSSSILIDQVKDFGFCLLFWKYLWMIDLKSGKIFTSCPVQFYYNVLDFLCFKKNPVLSWIRVNQYGLPDIVLSVLGHDFTLYKHVPYWVFAGFIFVTVNPLFRARMTNFFLINCCLTTLKRLAEKPMFRYCYVSILVMTMVTIL